MIEGCRHMSSICFAELEPALAFVAALNVAGLDISVQTYKTQCPPSALTKLPLITGFEAADAVLDRMKAALRVL